MVKKDRATTLVVILLTVLIVPFIVVLYGQKTTEDPKRRVEQKDDLASFKATFPIVEYSNADISEPLRREKSKKYGKVAVVNPNVLDNSQVGAHLDWEVGLSALPVDKSRIIVMGKVVQATAFLSENKASVYSEFEIEIGQIFKNDRMNELKIGDKICAERQGGVVRFATGFETWFFIGGQKMPSLQKQYLFFLSNDFPGIGTHAKDLHILTAYELTDGTVVPLDIPGGGTHPIAKYYIGKESSVLLSDLSDSLRNK